MGVRDYTAKEVLNKVLYNNTSLRTYTLSEGLNTILDAGNNRLKVNLQGGTIDGDVIVTGTLEVQGATTTIKSETILVTDKTFELAVPSSGSASDANSDGGGIILRGSTNKSILWNNANDWWNFNQGINVTGNAVFSGNVTGTFIGNVTGNVSGTAPAGTLTGATLANGVTASSLTSVGTLTSLTVSGAPFVISNTNNGNNIDIKTTSSGSLVHAVKIHSGGLFEAKQGVSSTTGTFTGNVLLMGADSYARDLTFRHGTANPNHYWRMGYTATGNGNTLAFINRDGGAEQEVMRMDYNKLTTFAGKVFIDQNATNAYAFEIDHEGNAYNALHIDASALTTGSGLHVYSGAVRTADYPLVEIQDDHGNAGGGYGLKVRVDGNGDYLRCYNEGNVHFKVAITGDTTTGGRLYTTAGSASYPAYSFSTDPDIGMYKSGTNEIGFATAGVHRMSIEDDGTVQIAGDVDMGRIKGNVAKSNAYMRSVTRGAGNATETFTPTHLGFTDNCQALIYVQVLGPDSTSTHYNSTGAILCHITMPRGAGNTTPHIIMSASDGSQGSGVSNFSVASSGNNFVVTKDDDLGCAITIIGGGGYDILSTG